MSEHKRIVIERAMATSYIAIEGMALANALQIQPRPSFFITFFSVRVFFVILAYIFSFVRLSRRFYFPGLREMPERMYWLFVLLILFAMKALFLRRFVELSPSAQLFDFAYIIFVVVTLLMYFQSQVGADPHRAQREQQIAYLIGPEKANLSSEELAAIAPDLSRKGKASQSKPWPWRLIELLLVVIISATISAYARDIVDFLAKLGFRLPNLLPPY